VCIRDRERRESARARERERDLMCTLPSCVEYVFRVDTDLELTK
jgi:hypothetical protein